MADLSSDTKIFVKSLMRDFSNSSKVWEDAARERVMWRAAVTKGVALSEEDAKRRRRRKKETELCHKDIARFGCAYPTLVQPVMGGAVQHDMLVTAFYICLLQNRLLG